jgi:hypothetical protein
MFFVVGYQDFHIKGLGTKIIPLRMDIIIVNGLGKLKFRIFPSVKGRSLVFFTDINMAPVIKWFNIMHSLTAIYNSWKTISKLIYR